MDLLTGFAATGAAIALLLQIGSCGIAARRCRPTPTPACRALPPVSLIRPACGLDHAVEETLASSFALDHPDYEILFCVADADDPVVPVIERLIGAHPGRAARLLVGRDGYAFNPKLDNTAKGWAAARHDWIVMADSNLLLSPDYLRRVLAAAETARTGLVSAPPAGIRPDGFWGTVEAAVLNTYQARVQYTVDAFGLGFAQGKTLALRRSTLDRAGGYPALGREPAEDAAATKAIRSLGLAIRLARPPFGQPLGRRTARAVWARQLRWARLRRATFPLLFVPEILSGFVAPALMAGLAATGAGWPVVVVLGIYGALWYAAEAMLARVAGWPITRFFLPAALVRDLAIPAIWIAAWLGSGYAWRGQTLTASARASDPGLAAAE